MKLGLWCRISVVILILGCPIMLLCQQSTDSVSISGSIERGRWSIGFSPSAFLAINPNFQLNANYYINDYLETNLEAGFLQSERENRTLNKFVLRPEFRFFPNRNIFYLGIGTHAVYFEGKSNYFHSRQDFTYQKQFEHTIKNLIIIPTFHLGVKGSVGEGVSLSFAVYAGIGWRNTYIDPFPEEYFRTTRALNFFDFSMYSERDVDSNYGMLHFNFNVSYRFQ